MSCSKYPTFMNGGDDNRSALRRAAQDQFLLGPGVRSDFFRGPLREHLEDVGRLVVDLGAN